MASSGSVSINEWCTWRNHVQGDEVCNRFYLSARTLGHDGSLRVGCWLLRSNLLLHLREPSKCRRAVWGEESVLAADQALMAHDLALRAHEAAQRAYAVIEARTHRRWDVVPLSDLRPDAPRQHAHPEHEGGAEKRGEEEGC